MENLKRSLFILFFIYICNDFIVIDANYQSNVYIAYLGEKPHDNHELIVQSHHDLLASVVGGKEQASKLMVHNYKYGFSGFSALLTKTQAKQLEDSPGVIHLIQDHGFSPQAGTRAPDYLGLSAQIPNNIFNTTNQGDGVIIGVIDTGIWANASKAFSDEGLGPIPSKWKGKCVSTGDFDASQHCNKKVIGARWHRKGASAKGFFGPNDVTENESASPLDMNGHGTHCASLAAGSEVHDVTYLGFPMGTFRGTAPRARLAIYKPCFRIRESANPDDDCFASDVIEAFDQAIHDGVDVLSVSVGPFPKDNHGDINNYINFAAYHAVASGITVVAAATNQGPGYQTMGSTSPWHITVAAAKMDADIMVPITLGTNNTFLGVPVNGMNDQALGLKKVITFDNSILVGGRMPSNNNTLTQMLKGNVAFFPEFSKFTSDINAAATLYFSVQSVGGVSLMVDMHPQYTLSFGFNKYVQIIVVEKEVAREIDAYTRLNADSMVTFGKPKLVQSKTIRSMIDYYSSRGPSKVTPVVLKPDIAAPGTNLLAAVPPKSDKNGEVDNGWRSMTGTSQATPTVAGLVALLKAAHPSWSPAAIKSALITTGSSTDPHGAQILAPFSPSGIAGPLDFGGGIANVNGASDPGLIYDMQPCDYLSYLCGVGYPIEDIKSITRDQTATCPNQKQSVMDVNLPSIGILGLQKSITIKRTITNVGPENSSYIAKINAPRGTKISVSPNVLKFDANCKRITFQVTIEKIQNIEKYADGSLTWTDNKNHLVRSPIVILP